MTDYLKQLKDNKDKILLGEIAAYIHDLGKLNSIFLEKQMGIETAKNYDHSNILSLDEKSTHTGKTIFSFLHEHLEPDGADGYDILTVHHGYVNGKKVDFKKHSDLAKTIILADRLSATGDRQWADDIQSGKFVFNASPFGAECEIDIAEMDKVRKQLYQSLETINLIWNKLKNSACIREKIIKEVSCAFYEGKSIADTQRPANDIDLWDHAHSTATMFKVLWAQKILGENLKTQNPSQPNDVFTVFIVNFDMVKIFAQVEKIGDLQGRLSALQEIQDLLQQVLEVDYAAGNEIYREPGLSCFLLPVQFAEGEGEREIREFLDDKLKEFCKDKLLLPYVFEIRKTQRIFDVLPEVLGESRGRSVPANSWHLGVISELWSKAQERAEACPLCGLLPVEGKSGSRSKNLCGLCGRLREAGQTGRRQGEGTVWVDEIADTETNRLAVLCIEVPLERWLIEKNMLQLHRFQLKNGDSKTKTLSYERVRRLWAAADDYFNQLTGEIKEELGECERLKLDLKPENESLPIEQGQFYLTERPGGAILYLDKNGAWLTVTRVKNKSQWLKELEQPLKLRLDRPGAPWFKATVENVEFQKYIPFAEVSRGKNFLVLLVPARPARKLAADALDSFERTFSKALGKLPLSLGIVYSPARFPLSLTLRGALAMQNYLRGESNRLRRAEVVEEPVKKERFVCLKLKIDGATEDDISFKIDCALGNNETGEMNKDDIYYISLPVVQDSKKPDQVTLWDGKEYDPVPAGGLKKGNQLKILTGKFDFEFLDSTARRFDLRLEREGKRICQSPGLRPLDVRHLKLIEKLEETIKRLPDITDTRLRNVHTLLLAKFKEWRLEDVPRDCEAWSIYENFAGAVVRKEFGELSPEEQNFLKKSVLSGLFYNWFELFYQVEKRNIRGDR